MAEVAVVVDVAAEAINMRKVNFNLNYKRTMNKSR